MLCDISKVHTGFFGVPKVTHSSEDENWGKPGHSKKIHAAPNFMQQGGYAFKDTVLQRVENEFWLIEVSEFQSWMFGFERFVGKWQTTELAENVIRIDYSYVLHSGNPLLYPFHWIFAKTFWRIYMKRVLRNIRVMAEGNEAYHFD